MASGSSFYGTEPKLPEGTPSAKSSRKTKRSSPISGISSAAKRLASVVVRTRADTPAATSSESLPCCTNTLPQASTQENADVVKSSQFSVTCVSKSVSCSAASVGMHRSAGLDHEEACGDQS